MDVSKQQLDFYWQHVKSRSAVTPIGFDERSVPLGVWGDDARFNKKKREADPVYHELDLA